MPPLALLPSIDFASPAAIPDVSSGDRNQPDRVHEKNNSAYHSLASPSVFPSPTTTHRSETEIAGKNSPASPCLLLFSTFAMAQQRKAE
jgi:hypothetical protein